MSILNKSCMTQVKKKKNTKLSWAIRVYLEFTCGSSVDTFLGGWNMCKFPFFISFFKKFLKANIQFFFFKTVASFNTHTLQQQSTHVYFFPFLVLKSKRHKTSVKAPFIHLKIVFSKVFPSNKNTKREEGGRLNSC